MSCFIARPVHSCALPSTHPTPSNRSEHRSKSRSIKSQALNNGLFHACITSLRSKTRFAVRFSFLLWRPAKHPFVFMYFFTCTPRTSTRHQFIQFASLWNLRHCTKLADGVSFIPTCCLLSGCCACCARLPARTDPLAESAAGICVEYTQTPSSLKPGPDATTRQIRLLQALAILLRTHDKPAGPTHEGSTGPNSEL